MELIAPAILLQTADYKENDLRAVFLTPERGKISAVFRGVKKPNAKLKAYAQPFCFGSIRSRERMPIVTACTLSDSFYELAFDIPKLKHAAAVLELADKASDYDASAAGLFVLVLRALRGIAYTSADPSVAAAKFLLELLRLMGYSQSVRVCAHCGERPETAFYSASAGGITCEACAPGRRLKDTTYADLRTLDATAWDELETVGFDCPSKLVTLLSTGIEKLLDIHLHGVSVL